MPACLAGRVFAAAPRLTALGFDGVSRWQQHRFPSSTGCQPVPTCLPPVAQVANPCLRVWRAVFSLRPHALRRWALTASAAPSSTGFQPVPDPFRHRLPTCATQMPSPRSSGSSICGFERRVATVSRVTSFRLVKVTVPRCLTIKPALSSSSEWMPVRESDPR